MTSKLYNNPNSQRRVTGMSDLEQVARNCAHWKDGRCESCGVPWQYYEVAAQFECPHFKQQPKQPAQGNGDGDGRL